MCKISRWITPLMKQIWVVISVLFTMLGTGMVLGFTSSLLPALAAPESTIKMNKEATSWLVACLGIFCLVGFFLSSIFMNVFGRRIAYALDLLPGIAGMLLTYCAPDSSCLIAGRALSGITAGATTVLGAVVIGEYTSPKYRPMFLNLKTAFIYLGSTIVHFLGNFLHWRIVAIISTFPLIVSLLLVYTWPESPFWLAERKMFEKSEQSFYWLRGKTDDSTREIKELIRTNLGKPTKMCFREKVVDFFYKFTKKNFLKPVVIFVFAAILLETSGRHIFPSFASQIVNEIMGGTNSFYFTLGIDIIITCSALFSAYLIKVMNIRTLLFSTGFVSFVLLMLACCYMFLSSTHVIPKDYSWIPMSLFALFYVFANLGCAPIPLALVGEIFPLEHKAVGSSIAGYLMGIFLIVALTLMPIMIDSLKIYGAFTILGGCMAIVLVGLFFMLPETKNKTLLEIEDFFNNGKFRHDSNTMVNDEEDESNVLMANGRESSAVNV